ncbi:spectrin alpha chain, erythrocytic 1 [Carlito syrichta]|uniref:Spectrin alpha chain, erythrocytic 1 n=1 Tax=Carlito syrichta TaxID=1868482 RepID=A0A1U7UKH2_CARSF|nr:spectrin alpha chain, erythrocytic 1 [Carlito syrichta]
MSYLHTLEVRRGTGAGVAKGRERQVKNFEMCQEFEQNASAFLQWILETRSLLKETGTLESQLEANKRKQKEIQAMKRQLTKIEDLGDNLEEALVLDIKYSTIGLAQQWDQLYQLGMRMQHNLEQQIQAKDTIGVSEETLKEFSTTYKHFDENLTGRLTHKEFRSCLRGLNYYLPMVEEGEPEPKFEKFLDAVDPVRKGYVSLEDYTAFLIDKESENIKSSDEIENTFQALAEGKAYITKEDMKQVRCQLLSLLCSHDHLDIGHLSNTWTHEVEVIQQATTMLALPVPTLATNKQLLVDLWSLKIYVLKITTNIIDDADSFKLWQLRLGGRRTPTSQRLLGLTAPVASPAISAGYLHGDRDVHRDRGLQEAGGPERAPSALPPAHALSFPAHNLMVSGVL